MEKQQTENMQILNEYPLKLNNLLNQINRAITQCNEYLNMDMITIRPMLSLWSKVRNGI